MAVNRLARYRDAVSFNIINGVAAGLREERRIRAAGPGGFGASADRLEELWRMIEREIGVPHARDASQCKLIAFGSKPCGGPWRYLVYSTATTKESTLAQLVSEFNQLQQTINEERRIVSDCAVTPKPRLELVDGVCRANRQ